MRLVVKIGGSLCIGWNGPKASYFSRLVPVLRKLKKRHQLIVAIGGGRLVRNYYKSIEKFGLSRKQAELIAIDLLHANARFLAAALGMRPIRSLDEIGRKSSGVISGIAPGRSTDANAALAAARIKADLLVKMTNVGGIYTSDPRKYRKARKLDHVKFSDLNKYSVSGRPGSYGILDRLAVEAIAKNRIRTVVMSGRKPENLLELLDGRKLGTLVS